MLDILSTRPSEARKVFVSFSISTLVCATDQSPSLRDRYPSSSKTCSVVVRSKFPSHPKLVKELALNQIVCTQIPWHDWILAIVVDGNTNNEFLTCLGDDATRNIQFI